MITRWDERYDQETFIFGTEPNDFLRQGAHRIRGHGEGGWLLASARLGRDGAGLFAFA